MELVISLIVMDIGFIKYKLIKKDNMKNRYQYIGML